MLFFLSSLILAGSVASPPSAIHARAEQIKPLFEVSSQKSLVDEDFSVKLSKLQPLEVVKIEAEAVDSNDVIWSSFALFQANLLGEIDLSKQSPIDGSYAGIDGTGLLWSMKPSAKGASFAIKGASFSVKIKAYREKEVIGSEEIVRVCQTENVERISVRENGLNAILFLPKAEKPLPLIITLNGANGGFGENRSQLLASRGFAVLALAYFGVEGLPACLQEIPLEYFETAFAWVKKEARIDSSRTGLYGISRGGELSLLLGSCFPESIHAIAAVVPSSVVYSALRPATTPAWIYQGKPALPFAPVVQTDFGAQGQDPSCPADTVASFLGGMKEEKAFAEASIPVEKIKAPLLLVSGGADLMWPADVYVSQIEKRLKEKNSPISHQHLHYPKAGHAIHIPNLPQSDPVYYHPIAQLWLSMGGTPAADQQASLDSWKQLISFFDKSLKGSL